MSTEDKDLEFAAKAAGYWCEKNQCIDYLPRLGWDPRDDDGDAFRLAIALSIIVDSSARDKIAITYSINSFENGDYEKFHFPNCLTDMEPVRRAIFFAAAEIGKAMP